MTMRELAVAGCFIVALGAGADMRQDPPASATWSFDVGSGGLDEPGDQISGNHAFEPGVRGRALKLDGYTTVLRRPLARAPRPDRGLTVEAWVALAAYPWDWAPIVDHSDEQVRGYSFAISARGELGLKVAADGRWLSVTSAPYVMPLRQWTHVAARYDAREGLTVFINGRAAATHRPEQSAGQAGRPLTGAITVADGIDLLVGAVRSPVRPAHWHRFKGTQPSWFSLDGLLDEVTIQTAAVADDAIARSAAVQPPEPALAPRVLPAGPDGPGRFGAYYANLRYYPEWDALWRVGPDPDVIVRFDTSPVRVVFWRGTQYSPAWVSGTRWMADQSVEGYDRDFTWEHMNDKQNRYSHVRIIESTDARAVVHWRYALVNVEDKLWNVTPRLENGAWIDEYYYFYPDATGVRKVTWARGSLGSPIQFQESIVLTQPGQLQGDVINPEYATVGNLAGDTAVLSYLENPAGRPARTFPPDLTVQMHNFKSPHKPFIVFEPGNRMRYLRDMDIRALARAGSGNHWPVGQTKSDGRTSQATDRPSHFLGFPISNPPIHQGADGRDYWAGLYGMTDRGFTDLLTLARSWSTPADATVTSEAFESLGFDRSERAWRIRRRSAGSLLALKVSASAHSPVRNVALVVENWGDEDAALQIDGRSIARGRHFRTGHRHHVDRTDLLVWIETAAERPTAIILKKN
jgi:hypothetical protein